MSFRTRSVFSAEIPGGVRDPYGREKLTILLFNNISSAEGRKGRIGSLNCTLSVIKGVDAVQ
jgi:hypothetical protein